MTNAELVAEARKYASYYSKISTSHVLNGLADALERTERERDEAVAREAALRDGLQWAFHNVGYLQPDSYANTSSIILPTQAWRDAYDKVAALLATPSPAAKRLLAQVKAADEMGGALSAMVYLAEPQRAVLVKEARATLAAYQAAKEGII